MDQHNTIGIRVNPNYSLLTINKQNLEFSLNCYFWFSAANEKLLNTIYNFFDANGYCLNVLKKEDALLVPDMFRNEIATPEIYFKDVPSLKNILMPILTGYNLIDIRTKERISLDDIIVRAEVLFSNLKKKQS